MICLKANSPKAHLTFPFCLVQTLYSAAMRWQAIEGKVQADWCPLSMGQAKATFLKIQHDGLAGAAEACSSWKRGWREENDLDGPVLRSSAGERIIWRDCHRIDVFVMGDHCRLRLELGRVCTCCALHLTGPDTRCVPHLKKHMSPFQRITLLQCLQCTSTVLQDKSDIHHPQLLRFLAEPGLVAPHAWKASLAGACPTCFAMHGHQQAAADSLKDRIQL